MCLTWRICRAPLPLMFAHCLSQLLTAQEQSADHSCWDSPDEWTLETGSEDSSSIFLPCLLNQVLSWPWQQPWGKQRVKRNLQPWGRWERTGDRESTEVHGTTHFLQWGFTVNKDLLLTRSAISILKVISIFGVSCPYCLLQALI